MKDPTIQKIIDLSAHCTVIDGAGNAHSGVRAKISDLRAIESRVTALSAELAEQCPDCGARMTLGGRDRSGADYRCLTCSKIEVLKAELAELKQQSAEKEKDVKRLDWIQANARCDPKMDGNHVWWPTSFTRSIKGQTIRDAIDKQLTQCET